MIIPALLTALQALTPLDPLHMPDNLAPMRTVAAARPGLTVATRFALPRAVSANGVRRYGFHGLSYEYIAGRLARQSPALAHGRVIVAHLRSGASLCVLKDGVSIDTTTGFSALDGLVMATRCGLLDRGVILYLGRQGHSFTDIEDMLYRRSGLLGVSGISGDVRVLLASDDPHTHEALNLFTYRIAAEAGALISALGGLDGVVSPRASANTHQRSARRCARVCPDLGYGWTTPRMKLAWIGSVPQTVRSKCMSLQQTKKQ